MEVLLRNVDTLKTYRGRKPTRHKKKDRLGTPLTAVLLLYPAGFVVPIRTALARIPGLRPEVY